MSVDIGIGVSSESVRVVMLRRGRLAWHGERATSDSLPLGAALAELLADAPTVGWRRRSAVAAVGPSAMHLRRVGDLPPRASDRMLTAIVREDAGRYFVQTGAPPVITAARRRDGDVWVGALDSVVVTAIAVACERHDIRLRAAAPSVGLAGSLVESGALHWPDGEVVGLAEFEVRELVAYRRVPRATVSVEEPAMLPPVPVVDGTLSDPARFTDAWLAAKAGMSHSLAYRPESSHHAEADTRRVRRRLAFAALACAIGILSAMVMPIAGARYIEWHAGRTLATLQSDAQEAARSERALALASRELRALSAFDRSARLTTATLASLTTAIEPPTMLLSFQ
ncbi:MAG TPA: hypothetical protein VFI52_09495, partial [Gemmatimonadaceae bacterium]|nr:hypothetical protein [Gemmatimonadaceae bacterium]